MSESPSLFLFLFFVDMFFHFLLYLGIIGNNGSDILVLDLTINVVLGDFDNKRNHEENADKVGDHHQSVEGVGDIPCKR